MPYEFKNGANGEEQVINWFASHDIICLKGEKTNKYFDLSFQYDKKELTIEVKNDVMGAKTGNIALEFWNSRQQSPSGICVTKADFWVHIFKRELYITTVTELRKFIKNNDATKIIFSGGDKNANLYIYPATKILSTFQRADSFNTEKFKEYISRYISTKSIHQS